MNFHPFQLIKDILYIYNYGFLTGSASALILSFIIGKSAGRSIVNESENSVKTGILTGLSTFTDCTLISSIMLFLRTHEADAPINVNFQLRG